VQAGFVVQLEDFAGGQAEFGPRAMVIIVGMWDNRVQAVIAARHLEDNENGGIAASGGLRRGIRGLRVQDGKGVGQETRDRPGQRASEQRRAQKLPPCLKSEFGFHGQVN
jgi:hypothetical protein